MAKQPISIDKLSPEIMNGSESYRVKVGNDYVSISVKKNKSGVYFYARKRMRGKLHKAYVGEQNYITREMVETACKEVLGKEDNFWAKNQHRRRNIYGWE